MALSKQLVVGVLGLACASCITQGSGSALLRAPSRTNPGEMNTEGKIVFKWQGRGDSSQGSISAALPDGRQFKGTYLQPTSSSWSSSYQPYWNSWNNPWGGRQPWYGGSRSNFAVFYSGKVLAHLDGPGDTRMRCEFALYNPNAGLSGGGEGECQLSTNEDAFGAELHADK